MRRLEFQDLVDATTSTAASTPAWLLEPVFLDLGVQQAPINPEVVRRLGAVAARPLEGLADGLLLERGHLVLERALVAVAVRTGRRDGGLFLIELRAARLGLVAGGRSDGGPVGADPGPRCGRRRADARP